MISYKDYSDNCEFCRRDQQKSREERERERTSPVILVQVCIGHSAAGSCWNSRRG